MSTVDITVPAEQTEGTRSQLLRWLRAVGDQVVQDEPLVEVETDKVTVEIAAPQSGVLSEMLKHEQEELAPGDVLGRIMLATAVSSATGATAAAPSATGMSAAQPGVPVAAAGSGRQARPGAGSPSPAVLRLLAEHGLDGSAIAASGPGGRLTVEDVLGAAGLDPQAPPMAARSTATSTSLPAMTMPHPSSDPSTPRPAPREGASAPPAGVRRVPHTAVRRRIAEHMVHSLLHSAPHVTTVFEADLTEVLADRDRRRPELAGAGVPLTLTAYFVRATVAAIQAVPEANSQWTDSALEIHDDIHIGIGTAVENVGLMVPVLRNAQTLDLAGIARGLDDLTRRAREGRLTPADMRGGTFTISNHGVSGSLLAAPIIINQPQAAILGIGKLERRAVVLGEGAEERIVARPRCYVTLTLDHRVMDGQQANRFMQVFTGQLEQPGQVCVTRLK